MKSAHKVAEHTGNIFYSSNTWNALDASRERQTAIFITRLPHIPTLQIPWTRYLQIRLH